jgi:hypothetical protein
MEPFNGLPWRLRCSVEFILTLHDCHCPEFLLFQSMRGIPDYREYPHRVLVLLGLPPPVQSLQFLFQRLVAVLQDKVIKLPVVHFPLSLVPHVIFVLFHVHIHG